MNLESTPINPKNNKNIKKESIIPEKGLRLIEIFKKINEAQTASTAKEANNLVNIIFKEIENSYKILEKDKMFVFPFEECSQLKYENHTIYFKIYDQHIIFYGENGSIEIRRIKEGDDPHDSTIIKNPIYEKESMQLTFEKAGADGKKVWD